MSWHGQPRRVSVLAEMALRQEKVSERLRELRERNGLSQEDAARKVGITHRQWQRWESGDSMPYPRSLDMVASTFGISVAEFFDPAEPVVDQSQLDRIEAKLDQVLAILKQPGDIAGPFVESIVNELEGRGVGDPPAADPSGGGSKQPSGAKRAAPQVRARGSRKA
jgi:transcriptional regulator with XRE-family HTH domain